MRTGGKGGANTQTGLRFERETDLAQTLLNYEGYKTVTSEYQKGKSDYYELYYDEKHLGTIIQKYSLYTFLEHEKIEWNKFLSKRLLPDDCIYHFENNTIYIIEKKYQEGGGSVDEKLQTCDFKKKQYEKIFSLLGIQVEYYYLLNDWFNNPKNQDTFDYIKQTGCDYFFNEIPFSRLGLPISSKKL